MQKAMSVLLLGRFTALVKDARREEKKSCECALKGGKTHVTEQQRRHEDRVVIAPRVLRPCGFVYRIASALPLRLSSNAQAG
jgi:predicted Zn-ribbon and HTH transcriptional regulator